MGHQKLIRGRKKLIMGHQKASLIFLTLFTKKKTFNFPNKAKNPKNKNITSSGIF